MRQFTELFDTIARSCVSSVNHGGVDADQTVYFTDLEEDDWHVEVEFVVTDILDEDERFIEVEVNWLNAAYMEDTPEMVKPNEVEVDELFDYLQTELPSMIEVSGR
jgi:hypothetical protein